MQLFVPSWFAFCPIILFVHSLIGYTNVLFSWTAGGGGAQQEGPSLCSTTYNLWEELSKATSVQGDDCSHGEPSVSTGHPGKRSVTQSLKGHGGAVRGRQGKLRLMLGEEERVLFCEVLAVRIRARRQERGTPGERV